MEGDHTPMPLVATPFSETHGQISPDGKWIAYTSNSTGGRNEIYVKPFPDGTGGWQVSTSGGDWPRWTHDGKELLYHSLGLAGAASVSVGPTTFPGPLFAAPVSASGATFEPGSPKEVVIILVVNLPHSGGDYHTYAISPDGQRILYNQFVPPATAAATGQLGPDPPSGLMVALNWSSALKK
jgi:hypothetical protein